ncbi:DUF3883 domain-containing protein [Christiangramia forsetii]|uniref:Protein NO VEIN C-terminal domain-containing protein n=2 Tax=Christiangramia forsetii TaxID=411153 RepID=A0LZW3_CHRFK|nr:DUF3883 domain-containing protein [Christiangramia forsetii]GGG46482.1 hypothetical protein GCM10011532_32960 [Christiangramia forsetii]CAL65908.1 conserved hypothetical protein [Christiangramia forsetii KT0803]
MKITELRDYQIEFEKKREYFNSGFKEINGLRKKFTTDYPINGIKDLTKDEYVIGKGDSTFCNRIENDLNEWGNIHGSPAIKFGLYFGKYGEDKTRKYRIGRKEYGTDENIAFEKILSAIVELLENKDDFRILKKNPISPMFKGKILSVYYPNDFLNIFSAKHLNYFINILGLDNESKSELDKQALLLNFKKSDKVMEKWSVYEFSKFLYASFGNPNNEIKEEKISKELKDFKLKDFPPIEILKFDYVDLQTNVLSETQGKGKNKGTKIDYSNRSRKFKRIGDRGEQIVLRAERKFLNENGKKDLAKLVDQISERDDSVGYDILSFELDGTKRLIEVKSTLRKIGKSSIYLSANELKVAENEKNYYFYIIYEAGSKRPKIWKVKSSDLLSNNNIIKEPILFKLNMNTN